MRNLHVVALFLTIFGGLVWGLIGLLNFDLIVLLFGTTILTKVVHLLFGVSGAYMLYHTLTHFDKLTKLPE